MYDISFESHALKIIMNIITIKEIQCYIRTHTKRNKNDNNIRTKTSYSITLGLKRYFVNGNPTYPSFFLPNWLLRKCSVIFTGLCAENTFFQRLPM